VRAPRGLQLLLLGLRPLSVAKNLAVAVAATALSLALAEGIFRRSLADQKDDTHEAWAWRQQITEQNRTLYQPSDDPRLVYEPVPGAGEFNSVGARDPREFAPRPAGRRVAVLGDSVAWGEHLDFTETLPHQLEGLLADTEVINFGVTGYDTADALARYERVVRPLHPTDVVLLFCLNDVLIMSGPWNVHGDDADRARKKAQDVLLDDLAPIRAETVEWVLGRREAEAPIKLLARARTVITTARYDRSDDYTDEFLLMYDRPDAWAPVEAALLALGAAVTADGARATLVISPVLRLWDDYRWAAIHARVASTARSAGFVVVDPIDRWRGTEDPARLRFPGDSIHFSGTGNRVLAEALAPALAGDTDAKAVAVAETPMDEVEQGLASGDCYLFDANSAGTRTENGVIAGATLLDDYAAYELSLLPSDKGSDVVFYCGSTRCTASDKAAVRAIDAGYTHVTVMREGIKGWKSAGKPTVPVTDATPKADEKS